MSYIDNNALREISLQLKGINQKLAKLIELKAEEVHGEKRNKIHR